MIRFSAALVAVAIGVLIGGIVASELLLVYIAIATSAVALVALTVGVVLKREELFGEGRGLAPAQAGASPGLSAHNTAAPTAAASAATDRAAAASATEVAVTEVPGHGASLLLPGTAVGPGAAFAGHSQAPSPPPEAARGTQPGRDPWGATPAAAPVPGTWQAPAASGATAGWGGPVPSVFAPRAAGTAATGQAPAPPSWFNPADRTASTTEAPPTTAVPVPGGGGWSWLNGDTTPPADEGKPQDAAALDEDDWPTRYSWLDDEPEEDAGSGESGAGDGRAGNAAEDGRVTPADTAAESNSPNLAATAPAAAADPVADPASAPGPDEAASDTGPGSPSPWPQPVAPPTVAVPTIAVPTAAVPTAAVPTVATPAVSVPPVPGTPDTGLANPGAAKSADAAAGEPPALHVVRDADQAAAAAEPTGEAPATAAGETADLVSVVRGVPRYHQEDCVLIRFMGEGDTQKMPVAQAREAGCTPCTACQPEG